MLQDKVPCRFVQKMCLWSQETIKSETLKSWTGSVSGPHFSHFSFLIPQAPLFSFLISLGLDHDAHQAESSCWRSFMRKSAQQSWLWSSGSHFYTALVSEWVGRQNGVHLTNKASFSHKLHYHAQVPLHRRVWSTSLASHNRYFWLKNYVTAKG